ncbi:MAG: hypothetical protein J3K34DRAFT_527790 [Monoraphidium minutum]|nr:MAG: hypothetical protein J3K34DRAFT_527790 [Monoraphidium minutum]
MDALPSMKYGGALRAKLVKQASGRKYFDSGDYAVQKEGRAPHDAILPPALGLPCGAAPCAPTCGVPADGGAALLAALHHAAPAGAGGQQAGGAGDVAWPEPRWKCADAPRPRGHAPSRLSTASR